MSEKPKQVSGVPANIITGFLGVGKTSAILQLLKNKPKEERWAVLVNEFGEIGIDGAILEGQYSEQQGVYIREVPGGCMCCTAGLPMRVALTQLLRRAKPDRLLIEPTGLGHPEEVLHTLNEENFQGVITVQKVVTLVDARQLSDTRYVEHEVFQQQIAIADIIVANKQDLYTEDDRQALKIYIQQHGINDHVVFTEQGLIDHSVLVGPKIITEGGCRDVLVANLQDYEIEADTPFPYCGYIKAENQGAGFSSVGWRFSSRFEFDLGELFAFLSGVNAQRLKATFITNNGCIAYNLTKDALTEVSVEHIDESRIEIIAHELNEDWEQGLFDCISFVNIDAQVH